MEQIYKDEKGSYVLHNFPFGICSVAEDKNKLNIKYIKYEEGSIYYMQKSYSTYDYYEIMRLLNHPHLKHKEL